MIAMTKGMLFASAILSAGFITAYDYVDARLTQKTAAATVAERFPTASEMFVSPLPAGNKAATRDTGDGAKGDRQASMDCAQQEWPYISQQCLIGKDGKPTRRVTRVITVERPAGENSSELVRMPVTAVAQSQQ